MYNEPDFPKRYQERALQLVSELETSWFGRKTEKEQELRNIREMAFMALALDPWDLPDNRDTHNIPASTLMIATRYLSRVDDQETTFLSLAKSCLRISGMRFCTSSAASLVADEEMGLLGSDPTPREASPLEICRVQTRSERTIELKRFETLLQSFQSSAAQSDYEKGYDLEMKRGELEEVLNRAFYSVEDPRYSVDETGVLMHPQAAIEIFDDFFTAKRCASPYAQETIDDVRSQYEDKWKSFQTQMRISKEEILKVYRIHFNRVNQIEWRMLEIDDACTTDDDQSEHNKEE